jgi:hypothetical protein
MQPRTGPAHDPFIFIASDILIIVQPMLDVLVGCRTSELGGGHPPLFDALGSGSSTEGAIRHVRLASGRCSVQPDQYVFKPEYLDTRTGTVDKRRPRYVSGRGDQAQANNEARKRAPAKALTGFQTSGDITAFADLYRVPHTERRPVGPPAFLAPAGFLATLARESANIEKA